MGLGWSVFFSEHENRHMENDPKTTARITERELKHIITP
jgi:hypothetical protein